jgi:hypothetical protein
LVPPTFRGFASIFGDPNWCHPPFAVLQAFSASGDRFFSRKKSNTRSCRPKVSKQSTIFIGSGGRKMERRMRSMAIHFGSYAPKEAPGDFGHGSNRHTFEIPGVGSSSHEDARGSGGSL